MELKQVDKNKEIMYRENGTVCLITETGVTDKLLDRARKIMNNKRLLIESPDSWNI
jgi:hypothetical protein